MKKNKFLIGCAVCILMVSSAFARDYERGFYVGGGAGLSILNSSDIGTTTETKKTTSSTTNTANGGVEVLYSSFFNSVTSKATFDYKLGGEGYLSLGYNFGNMYRTEVEFQIKGNDISKLKGAKSSPAITGTGEVKRTVLVANVLRDFPVGGDLFNAYAGVGLSLGKYSYKYDGKVKDNKNDLTIKKNVSSVGYQLIAGASVDLTDRLVFDVSYKLASPFGKLKLDSKKVKFNTTALSHSVLVGLRYNF